MGVIDLVRRGIVSALALATIGVPEAANAATKLEGITLTVALVEDPDFLPLDERLVRRALDQAAAEFSRRFESPAPKFDVKYRFDVDGFLGAYTNPRDPRCKPLYDARYRGGGKAEVAEHKDQAIRFLKKWSIDSLKGFIEDDAKNRVKSYDEIYDYYVTKYTGTVEQLMKEKTANGTPLVEPQKSAERSFVAWMCALERQEDSDVVITNTFILADLLTEPHPHSVFGKAKIGGIAMPSTNRTALGGQVLLATTFGIDTQVAHLSELGGKPATFDERAKILGAYLLAHEVAHAVFGIPDVFDHPLGCLMTSRPGATYRDGIEELDTHPEPCPKCRPYVESRKLLERGRVAYEKGDYAAARQLLLGSAKILPKHFHGSRKKRIAQIVLLSSKAAFDGGKVKDAEKFAKLAVQLDPSSNAATEHLDMLRSMPLRSPVPAVMVSRTTTTTSTQTD